MENRTDEQKEETKFMDITRYFRFGVFIILMLLLLVATFQFYFFAMATISTLFSYKYQSLVQAGFAACVIVVIIYFLRAVILKEK